MNVNEENIKLYSLFPFFLPLALFHIDVGKNLIFY